MSGESYLYEKLLGAMDTLATSPRSLQDRLQSAAMICIAVRADELSEEVRPKWEEIWNRVTSVKPAKDEGSIAATLAKMSDEEATEVAQLMWDLFCDLGDLAVARLPYPSQSSR